MDVLSRIRADTNRGRREPPKLKARAAAWTDRFSGDGEDAACPRDDRHLDALWKIKLIPPCFPRATWAALCRQNAWILTDPPAFTSSKPGRDAVQKAGADQRRVCGRRRAEAWLCAPKAETEAQAPFPSAKGSHVAVFVGVKASTMRVKRF